MISAQLDQLKTSFEAHRRLASLVVLVTTLAISPIGYHIIVLNVPSGTIQRAIADEFAQSHQINLSAGALGIICTKRSLLLFNNLLLVAASLAFLAISPRANALPLLILGRLLVGLYTGIGCSLVPIYVQELSPPHLKGALCCFVHIGICVGSAVGAFLSLSSLLGSASLWSLLLALPVLFAFAQIGLNQVLPETPDFFIRRANKRMAARSVRFHYSLPEGTSDEGAIREYRRMVPRMADQISFREALADAHIRRPLLLGLVASMAQIFSGSMAAVSYSTTMLESVSFTAWLTPFVPTLGSLLSVLLTLPALGLVESCGRKSLLVNTLALCAAANVALILFSLLSQATSVPASWPSVGFSLCLFVYGVGYNVGVGPVAYFLPAELVPSNSVSAAMGAATAINWLSSMLTTIVFYPLNEAIGGWSFLMFALPTALAALFFRRELPDSVGTGRSTPPSPDTISSAASSTILLPDEQNDRIPDELGQPRAPPFPPQVAAHSSQVPVGEEEQRTLLQRDRDETFYSTFSSTPYATPPS